MTKLSYKGYQGTVDADFDEGFLFGQIQFINDLVSYEGATVHELKSAFEEAVDDYLATCARVGKSPDKPYSGVFNVRTGPELHKQAARKASETGKTLNGLVVDALKRSLEEPLTMNHVHKHEVVIAPLHASVTAHAGSELANVSIFDELHVLGSPKH